MKHTFCIVFLALIVLWVAKTSSDFRSIQLPVDDEVYETQEYINISLIERRYCLYLQ